MFNRIKKELFFKRLHLLKTNGEINGLILPFENEIYSVLDGIVWAGTPAGIYIKHLKPILPPMKCWDRSYVISMALPNCELVFGYCKDIEYQTGSKDSSWHYWVENQGWCYDPTMIKKIKKELYYQMHLPTNIHKQTRQELEANQDYQDALCGNFNRFGLLMNMWSIEAIAGLSNNQDLIDDLEKFKNRFNFDGPKIAEELQALTGGSNNY